MVAMANGHNSYPTVNADIQVAVIYFGSRITFWVFCLLCNQAIYFRKIMFFSKLYKKVNVNNISSLEIVRMGKRTQFVYIFHWFTLNYSWIRFIQCLKINAKLLCHLIPSICKMIYCWFTWFKQLLRYLLYAIYCMCKLNNNSKTSLLIQ